MARSPTPPSGLPPQGVPPSGAVAVKVAADALERASPYPLSRLAPPFDLVDVAREIQDADRMLGAVVGGQLDVIAKQIHALQDQARTLLEKARVAGELHRAACHFKKRPGHIYHLYRRADGVAYFSMLSPADWGGQPPHAFEGSYRLEVDLGWTAMA
jgi:Protein of unknown function (DUF2452)